MLEVGLHVFFGVIGMVFILSVGLIVFITFIEFVLFPL